MATQGWAVSGQSAFQREIVAAAIGRSGLGRLAELASREAGAPVAILLAHTRGDGVGLSSALTGAELAGLCEYVRALAAAERVRAPAIVIAQALVTVRDEPVGAVLVLEGGYAKPDKRLAEILAVTAMATVTQLALGEARDDAGRATQRPLLKQIRGDPAMPETEILRRAGALGTDLGKGATALCARVTGESPERVIAIIHAEQPNALVEELDRGIYALLPPEDTEDPRRPSLEGGRRLAEVLAPYATVGLSSFYRQPTLLHRAFAEAELVVEVLTYETGNVGDDIGSPTYRLLINTLAKHPEEVVTFYEETIGPLTAHDEQHDTELAATVDAYLRENCNASATATALGTHRQTVTSRLERVRELTGLDPKTSEGCERLSLGLKLHRILAPRNYG
jgi:sugar diacid utilization regulator